MLPRAEDQPTLSASEVAAAFGIGVNAAYQQGNLYLGSKGADGIPAMRFGRSMRFPTAAVRSALGLD